MWSTASSTWRPRSARGYRERVARVTVFGAGAMGTAFAMHSARAGLATALWANEHDLAAFAAMRDERKHPLLPEHLPDPVEVHGPSELDAAARDVEHAVLAANSAGARSLAAMVRAWPFFRTVIDNLEQVLAKVDLGIARRYAELARDVPATPNGIPEEVAFKADVGGIRKGLAKTCIGVGGGYYAEPFYNWGGFDEGGDGAISDVAVAGAPEGHAGISLTCMRVWGWCWMPRSMSQAGQPEGWWSRGRRARVRVPRRPWSSMTWPWTGPMLAAHPWPWWV